MDDGDAEEEADVAPDLGVEVGQRVVPDDASQLCVNSNCISFGDVILVSALSSMMLTLV